MNREILFRGQTPEGKWVEGFYYHDITDDKHYIKVICIHSEYGQDHPYQEDVEVLPETVGQFTGKTDKNWKRIFEGDRATLKFHTAIYVCRWSDKLCAFIWECEVTDEYRTMQEECEIIGTVFDKEEKCSTEN